jgi:hypothetical protein
MRQLLAVIILLLLDAVSLGVSKPHVSSFGKTASAKWLVGADETSPMEIKVRALYIDGKLKEFTVGAPHDVTDHFFVVRRVFHLNDALPDEVNSPAALALAARRLVASGPALGTRLPNQPPRI